MLRGRAANPWELRAWEQIGDPYEVAVVVPSSNDYDTSGLGLETVPVQTISSRLPGGRAGALLTKAVGERYLGPAARLRGADIVHSAELGFWFSYQAARLKRELGFRLVLTVWETLPFGRAYRNIRTRRYVPDVLAATDLFLATSERARVALELEGAPRERIEVCPPGIAVERFAPAREAMPPAGGGHVILSAARLVWEKGHQDVIRALALLDRRDVRAADRRRRAGARAAARARERSRCRGPGRAARRRPLRRDARPLRAGVVPRPRVAADDVLGGAVRHGAGRGDGGARARAGRRERCDPGGRRRLRHAVPAGRLR